MIIGGRKVRTDREIEVVNPATRLVFATAARADETVLDDAVAAAKRAFPAWAAVSLPKHATLDAQARRFAGRALRGIRASYRDGTRQAVWIDEHMIFDFGVTVRGPKFSGLGGEFGPEGSNAYTQGFVLFQTSAA